jgi:hypothetical protein
MCWKRGEGKKEPGTRIQESGGPGVDRDSGADPHFWSKKVVSKSVTGGQIGDIPVSDCV